MEYFSGNIWQVQRKAVLLHPLKRRDGQVSYDQLPRNPPGWEHSKGTWL